MSAIDLHFNIVGEQSANPDIIILHGLFGMGKNWAPVAQALAGKYRILTVDLRNHGESPWTKNMTYPLMADDIAKLINSECSKPPIVIGHSMGGKVAMVFALKNPDKLVKLAVVDIAPVPYSHNYQNYLSAMMSLDISTVCRRSEAERALVEKLQDVNLVRFLLHNLRRGPDAGFFWQLNLSGLARNMDDLADFPGFDSDKVYQGNALFLTGANSDYVHAGHHAKIASLFKQPTFAIIEGAGHWVHTEQQNETIDQLHKFIRGNHQG
ncbi:MAG: hypothetical protein CBB68_01145 [Rhodospirillaceae bacterium TMED8]|nr:alpha/beta hydrolase [Magnetovibrio sp.]OUT53284.1 MAG: hypothetical protein CBB68_01145 [Rhodospirillaceae bacterium TMED8]|tara:strand:- start:1878 stop:2678 length:801 start_codon:yes stop_codon:yes gene_type:complete